MGSELQAGKYLADGQSASAPSYSFGHTTATGMYSPGANQIRFSTASIDRLTISSTGAVSIPSATAAGSQLTIGNVHGKLTFSNNSGTAGTTNIQQTYSGGVAELRFGSNVATTSSSAMNISTGDAGAVKFNGLATFNAGVVTSEKGVLSGSVTVADDAVTTITPQRKGGFLKISADTTSGDGNFPQVVFCGEVYFDCGVSLDIRKHENYASGFSTQLDVSTSDVSGSTGTDGNVTVAVQAGVIKIENRRGGVTTFNYTITC